MTSLQSPAVLRHGDHRYVFFRTAAHADQANAETRTDNGGGAGLTPTALPDGTGLRIEGDADLASRDALHAALSFLDTNRGQMQLSGRRSIDADCLAEIMALAQPPRHLVLLDPPG